MGFRGGRSCADSIVCLASSIRASFASGEVVVCAFLDIRGAFDGVVPSILIQDLADVEIPACTRMFVANLIAERRVHFVINGSLEGPFLAHRGSPQGSVLSPLLFNLYLRDIGKYIDGNSEILQYADDVVIFASSRDLASAVRSVQRSVSRFSGYLRERGLEIAPNKSQIVVFNGLTYRPSRISHVMAGLFLWSARPASWVYDWTRGWTAEGTCRF